MDFRSVHGMTWATKTATELAGAIRSKDVSSRELLELYLDRVERLNPSINAVVTLDADRARQAAAAADDATARGDELGPLHGLPITIKDAIEVEGVRSTGGAVALTDHVPTADAYAVSKLKQAGAVVFGKTNVPEWSGDLQTFNEIFGTTNNPWDTSRAPGGSSGGPAAAVATGLTAFELGTDIGGSIRIPSHCCGIYGIKPSFGVVPQRGYLDHVGGGTTDADINVFGPLARSAPDLELLLGVLAGPPPEDETAWRLDLPAPRRRDASAYRVGVWFDAPDTPVDSDMLAILRRAADSLADAGAKVEDAHPPVNFTDQLSLFFTMITAAISPSMADEVADAMSQSHRAWLRGEEQRAALKATWAEWFETYDALLCPVMPAPAIPHTQNGDFFSRTISINGNDESYTTLISWTGLIGIVGLPSAVPPLGRTTGGLPVGVQVVTPYLRDREAIQLAGLLAEVTDGGGYDVPPGFAS
jgi:amidase